MKNNQKNWIIQKLTIKITTTWN